MSYIFRELYSEKIFKESNDLEELKNFARNYISKIVYINTKEKLEIKEVLLLYSYRFIVTIKGPATFFCCTPCYYKETEIFEIVKKEQI